MGSVAGRAENSKETAETAEHAAIAKKITIGNKQYNRLILVISLQGALPYRAMFFEKFFIRNPGNIEIQGVSLSESSLGASLTPQRSIPMMPRVMTVIPMISTLVRLPCSRVTVRIPTKTTEMPPQTA